MPKHLAEKSRHRPSELAGPYIRRSDSSITTIYLHEDGRARYSLVSREKGSERWFGAEDMCWDAHESDGKQMFWVIGDFWLEFRKRDGKWIEGKESEVYEKAVVIDAAGRPVH